MKSYTDLEQSKKLAEILPLESADMHYAKDFDGSWFIDLADYTSVKIPKYVDNIEEHLLPCWSLGALFSVLPHQVIAYNSRFEFSMLKGLNKNGETYRIKYTLFLERHPFLHLTDAYNNPVDACIEMILKLHELNLLKS